MVGPSSSSAAGTSLREEQRAVTERRIVVALAALIADEHPLDISMAAVAKRAGISEPTLYRHFPTKRDLFAALARYEYGAVAAGVAPASITELVEAIQIVFRRSAEMENVIRWTLAAPDPVRVPRPNVASRLDVLRRALAEPLSQLDEVNGELLLRTVLLLTSPMAWMYWKDYLGLEPGEAAEVAGWAVQALSASAR
jgi:AcrR family transcriptional regulator